MFHSFLIVDDSRAIQAILRRTIDAGGYDNAMVLGASTGQEALDTLDRVTPDLVITDWHMPGMTGLELLQSVRQIHGHSLKVGLVTTETSPDLLRQARASGAEFILHKPFHDRELLDALQRAVGAPGSPPPEVTSYRSTPVSGDTHEELAPAVSEADPDAAFASAPSTGVALPVMPPPAPASSLPRATPKLEALLSTTLGPIRFRLVDKQSISATQLTPKVLLALYALPGQKAAYAVGLLDMTCLCMIGAGAMGMQPSQVRPAIATGSATAPMVERATQFLRDAAVALPTQQGEVPLMLRATLVPRDLDKLISALGDPNRVLGFRLQVPGYGEGRFVFVRL
jgi:CheY-like chemotaxis protein